MNKQIILTEKQAKSLTSGTKSKPRQSKYRNVKTKYDGINFDSKKECERYKVLKQWQQKGLIKNLVLQPKFLIAESVQLDGKKQRARYYIADFMYQDQDNNQVVEDVKGMKTDIYKLKRHLVKEKHGIEFFSIGGGIGIVYQGTLDSGVQEWWNEDCAQLTLSTYAQAVVPTLQPLGLHIIVEPGRLIVGNAGALITRCLYEKNGKAKTFKIVDAGMNDLIRPALYQGYHEIIPVREHPSGSCVTADVVGPICESGDFLAQNRDMPDVRQGELLAVLSAGAYGFSMSSNYNSRPMAEEVLVDGDQWNVIRSRQSWEDLIRGESIPE